MAEIPIGRRRLFIVLAGILLLGALGVLATDREMFGFLPRTVPVPVFFLGPVYFALALAVYAIWVWPIWVGRVLPPQKYSEGLMIVAVLFSGFYLYESFGWAYDAAPTYTIAVLASSLTVCAVWFVLMARARWTHSFWLQLAYRWSAILWLFWLALPYLGENP